MSQTTSSPPVLPPSIAHKSWSERVLQPVLIGITAVSLTTALLILLHVALPMRPWFWLLPLCAFAAGEGILTTHWLFQPERRTLNHTLYRATELVSILFFTRFYTWFVLGNWPDLNQIYNILLSPILLFADVYFLVATLLAWITWQRAVDAAHVFLKIAPDTAEIAYYSLPRHKRQPENRPVSFDRSPLLMHFFQQWIYGSVVLVFCAALTTFDLVGLVNRRSLFGLARLGLRADMLVTLLLYFLAGFLLISQGRFAILRARWLAENVRLRPEMERKWYQQAWRLLLVVGLVAAFLPIGSTVPIGRLVAWFFRLVLVVVNVVFYLFSLVFIGLFALISFLLGSGTPDLGDLPAPPPPPSPPDLLPEEVDEAIALFFGSFFWGVVVVAGVLALIFFLRDRGVRLEWGWVTAVLRAIRNWWYGLWQDLSQQITRVWPEWQQPKRPSSSTPAPARWRFIRLNALSPRDQIRYFYLSTVRRASDKGVARQVSETPLEYAHDLKENWPEADTDVESLTDAFLKAQYSPSPIVDEEVHPVKVHWKRLKARLRGRKRPSGR
ncbi:MAG: DUF4129 domain-containing protein [Chloroflexi bacterium]|nr:MAG: DUF4129 domain-containing protein [Chloroflexota bacterium]